MAATPDKPLMRCVGEFVGYILNAVKSNPKKHKRPKTKKANQLFGMPLFEEFGETSRDLFRITIDFETNLGTFVLKSSKRGMFNI